MTKPLQYCKVISLQLIKKKEQNKKNCIEEFVVQWLDSVLSLLRAWIQSLPGKLRSHKLRDGRQKNNCIDTIN